jgi:methionine synthase II (cobalamin-independent)
VFSTLIGALPPDLDDEHRAAADGTERTARDNAADLAAAGIDLVSDGVVADAVGGTRDGAAAGGTEPDEVADRIAAHWSAVADAVAVPVKQVLLGPYSTARRTGSEPRGVADVLRAAIVALAGAGCPLVEVDEPDALAIATEPAERSAFVAAHERLLDGVAGIHASLAMTGGNFDGAGAATFFDLPYASFGWDLIAGPENWRLITQAPADRGIVCGALDARPGGEETREVLVWAAHYAAASQGRGLARVGLANASSLAQLPRSEALRKLSRLAEASRIASVESTQEMAGLLDPRAVDARSAALGRFAPARRRRP